MVTPNYVAFEHRSFVWAVFGSCMDDSPWWPKGIIAEDSENLATDRIHTIFGSFETWDFQESLKIEWWQEIPREGTVWGQWPNVSDIEILHQDRKGFLVRINDRQIARITPFHLGNDLSLIHI